MEAYWRASHPTGGISKAERVLGIGGGPNAPSTGHPAGSIDVSESGVPTQRRQSSVIQTALKRFSRGEHDIFDRDPYNSQSQHQQAPHHQISRGLGPHSPARYQWSDNVRGESTTDYILDHSRRGRESHRGYESRDSWDEDQDQRDPGCPWVEEASYPVSLF